MPPPHLAVLNPQNSEDEAPARSRLAWLRASLATSLVRPAGDAAAAKPALLTGRSRLLKAPVLPEKGVGGPKAAAPDALAERQAPARAAPINLVPTQVAEPPRPIPQPFVQSAGLSPQPAEPPAAPASRHDLLARTAKVIDDRPVEPRGGGPKAARAPQLLPMAKLRTPRAEEDLLADLPPAQVPLRISVAPLPFSTPVPRPAALPEGARPPAAERAFRTGRQGARPAHAMSAVEIAAWREGAMEAGRARDPIIGVPRLWWWLALALILVMPMAYAAGWLGMAGSGAEFLSTPVGQEAWILMGGPNGVWFYWGLLFVAALVAQLLRPLEPVLIMCGATWWVWTGLHAAWVAGWLAQRIPPMPLPG